MIFMASWIYFFSKFTDEAIVFEMLAFFILVASYAAYYLIRKRHLREADQLIPLSALREYLDNNILETNEFRIALFGEALKVADPDSTNPGTYVSPTDPAAQKKVAELQIQLEAQMKLIEELKTQKEQIETQVAAGGATASDGGAAPQVNGAELDEVRNKLKAAEDRLAEYSVIEDDLANLKRLQQENAKLKAQLGGGTGATAAAAPQVAAPAAEIKAAAPAAPAAEPTLDNSSPEIPVAAEPTLDNSAPDIAAAPDAGETTQTGGVSGGTNVSASAGPEFEQAVDQIEAGLAPSTEPALGDAADSAPAVEAAAPEVSSTEGETQAKPKNDEDLLAEFEKMLGA